MTTALKKQLCYAGGTLAGWFLSRAFSATQTVPFTVMGGVAGFALAEGMIGPDPVPKVIRPVAGLARPRSKKRKMG